MEDEELETGGKGNGDGIGEPGDGGRLLEEEELVEIGLGERRADKSRGRLSVDSRSAGRDADTERERANLARERRAGDGGAECDDWISRLTLSMTCCVNWMMSSILCTDISGDDDVEDSLVVQRCTLDSVSCWFD